MRSWVARFLAVLVMPTVVLAAMAGLAPASSAATVSRGLAEAPAAPAGLAAAPAALQVAIRESLAIPPFGEGYSQRAELGPSDETPNDMFGLSVALSAQGTEALVGAPIPDHIPVATGAAYVFTLRSGTWSQTAVLTASNAVGNDMFGSSVALSAQGTEALVGAPGEANSGAGAAYVFTLRSGTWSQTRELTASNATPGSEFGFSVALSAPGSTALVGAKNPALEGAAYVFTSRFGTWSQAAELTPSDGADSDNFGNSVALSAEGNEALVGALNHDAAVGAAYLFTLRFRTWSQAAELTASDAASGDVFGFSVALSAAGNEALVGAPGHDGRLGAAYVFTPRFRSWSQAAELTASDAVEFGWSVALSAQGSTALVGATGNNLGAGAAYVFTLRFRTWSQAAELTASDAQEGANFGYSVALSAQGSTALVGAPRPALEPTIAGAAYVFSQGRGA